MDYSSIEDNQSRKLEEMSLLRKSPFSTVDIQMKDVSNQQRRLLKLINKSILMDIFRTYCPI